MQVALFPFIPNADGRVSGKLLCGLSFDLDASPQRLQSMNSGALAAALGLPEAIDWGAIFQALIPMFSKSLTPSAGATESFTQIIMPDGGYICWPESLTARLSDIESKLLIQETYQKLTGKRLAGPILDILLKLLPLLAPVLLPLLLSLCKGTSTTTTPPPDGGPIAP